MTDSDRDASPLPGQGSLPNLFTAAGPAHPLRSTDRMVNLSAAKRKGIVVDLYETTKNFQRSLRVIDEIFVDPLRASKIVASVDVARMFHNVLAIYRLNGEIVEALEGAMESPAETLMIGSIYLDATDFGPGYKKYCEGVDEALDAVGNLRRSNKNFASFLEEALVDPLCHGVQLEAFLQRPREHVLECPRLLRRVLDETTTDHPDYRPLSEAVSKMTEVADQVKRAHENKINMQKLNELQASVEGLTVPLVAFDRKHLRHSSATVTVDSKTQDMEVDLFSDALMLSKRRTKAGRPLKCVAWIPLSCILIRDAAPVPAASLPPGVPDGSCSFEIVRSDQQKIYRMWFGTEPALHQMRRAIDTVLNAILEQSCKEHVKDREKKAEAFRVHQKIKGMSLTHDVASRYNVGGDAKTAAPTSNFGTVRAPPSGKEPTSIASAMAAFDMPQGKGSPMPKKKALPQPPNERPAPRPADPLALRKTGSAVMDGGARVGSQSRFTRAPDSMGAVARPGSERGTGPTRVAVKPAGAAGTRASMLSAALGGPPPEPAPMPTPSSPPAAAPAPSAASAPGRKRLEEVPEDLTMEEFLANTSLQHIATGESAGVSSRISYAQVARKKTVSNLSTKTTRRGRAGRQRPASASAGAALTE